MRNRLIVSPRFELFFALAEVLDPTAEETLWLAQARRKLDQATRRRMRDLALSPKIWLALASVAEAEALDGDTEAVIAAVANLPSSDFGARLRAAMPRDPAFEPLFQRLAADSAGLQQAAVDALRRFDRLVFAAFWRRAQPDLEQAARNAPATGIEAIVFPSLFGEHRFTFGDVSFLALPPDRLTAARVTPDAVPRSDPERIFHALGDTTRYAIARLIAREPLTGAELARRLGVSGPTLTYHLRRLRAARLVLEERRGNSILLRLDRSAIETLSMTSLEALFGAEPIAIRRSRKG